MHIAPGSIRVASSARGGWENEAGGGRLPEGLERRGERLSHGYIRAQDEDRELIRERERRY